LAIEKILIVDDALSTRELLSAFFASSDYQVSFASGGREAAALVAKKPFDLVITDMYMPEGDGIELIRKLRRDFPHLPIVAMTGPNVVRAEDYLNQATCLSVDGILMKPFLRQQVLNLVHQVDRAAAVRAAARVA